MGLRGLWCDMGVVETKTGTHDRTGSACHRWIHGWGTGVGPEVFLGQMRRTWNWEMNGAREQAFLGEEEQSRVSGITSEAEDEVRFMLYGQQLVGGEPGRGFACKYGSRSGTCGTGLLRTARGF